MERASHCRRCGQPHDATRMFCPGCGKILEPRSLSVRVSTDESRGRALDEMYKGVERGRAEFQRDIDQRFENAVYEHFRSA